MRISTAGVAEKEGRYLVALRKPGTSIGTKWEFPGGKTESGESPEEALKREFMEELSLLITVEGKIFEGEFHNRGNQYKLKAFKITIETPFSNIRLTEHSEYRWVLPEEMNELAFAESDGLIRNFLMKCNNSE